MLIAIATRAGLMAWWSRQGSAVLVVPGSGCVMASGFPSLPNFVIKESVVLAMANLVAAAERLRLSACELLDVSPCEG